MTAGQTTTLDGQGVRSEDSSTTDYNWGISHDPTREELVRFLDSLSNRRGLASSTITTKRSRLSKYARLYEECHGTGNLLDPTEGADLSRGSQTAESVGYRRALAVFDILDAECDTDRSKLMYHSDVNQFYKRLKRWGLVEFNPVSEIPAEFDWEREDSDNAPLAAADVTALYTSAVTQESQLLVLSLAAWGLRPNEVASLHRDQVKNLAADEDVNDGYPYIEFGTERKNGPGTVTVLFGQETLRKQFRRNDSPYAFPSSESESGHITTKTVQNRFERLAKAVGIRVRGETPTPKMGRRFWYTTFQDVMGEIYEELEIVAEEQGSSSAEVVEDNYLSEAARRRMRRERMREEIADAFTESETA